MNPLLVGLVVFVGSALGLLGVYPHAHYAGLLFFGLINGSFASLAALVLIWIYELVAPALRRR